MSVSKRITIEELQSYLWNSAVLLRTNIDAGAYKQYIFPLLFFKRICDVYDEECQQILAEYGDEEALEWEENHRFIVPKGAHWRDVRSVSENIGVAITEAFRKIESANSDMLQGIFGDGAWTNKNRLPDRLLKDLIEHFSTKTLSIANCPEDELGQGYEYLIKKFADDSGHTAQEFYTNRTVVHLMTEMLKPQSGESVYDPTCGSAGMLTAKRPFVIIERPNYSVPDYYQNFEGRMCNKTAKLGSLSGFTMVDAVHLDNVGATTSEITEIEAMLKAGVIL